jgi:hypothetical protein
VNKRIKANQALVALRKMNLKVLLVRLIARKKRKNKNQMKKTLLKPLIEKRLLIKQEEHKEKKILSKTSL